MSVFALSLTHNLGATAKQLEKAVVVKLSRLPSGETLMETDIKALLFGIGRDESNRDDS